jgi:hypothetical protein
MGRIYCGPYAEQLGGAHEGYAAIVLPDGTLAVAWTASTVIVAHVAACDCGWTGGLRHAASEAGEDAAVAQWEREHLDPLITAAARNGWPAWAQGVAGRVTRIEELVRAGDLRGARELMRRVQDDVRTWGFVLNELVEEAGR